MELSPKQQAIELIKKAEKILILGHKEPSGDFLGSALAIAEALKSVGKKTEVIVSDPIPEIFKFLPFINEITTQYRHSNGKIIRINTQKIPVKSMQWQKGDNHLDIILETEKNLKFEFLEIINGKPKPDLIIVLCTTDTQKIDKTYDENTKLFFEVPIINIDHHAGNDYFGTVNLVDLTATSSAEILVSLFESLGIKIDNPDIATCLLTGIISETQSFRTQNTTPKSLTVAAQLLAAGARQQEIISNLYKKRPLALLKLWGDMLAGLSSDHEHRFAWTKVSLKNTTENITPDDVFDAADELLSNTPEADLILIICETKTNQIEAKLKAKRGKDALEIAKIFDGDGISSNAYFSLQNINLERAEPFILKEIHAYWQKTNQPPLNKKEVWDVLTPELSKKGKNLSNPSESSDDENIVNQNSDDDIIERAIESLEKKEGEKKNGFASIGEILKQKIQSKKIDKEIDIFDEESD